MSNDDFKVKEKAIEFHEKKKKHALYTSELREKEGTLIQKVTLVNEQIFTFRLTMKNGALEVFPNVGDENYSTEAKEAFLVLMSFWEELGREIEHSILQFQEAWYKKLYSEAEIDEVFIRNGYRYIGMDAAITLGSMKLLLKKAASYVKELHENALPEFIPTTLVMNAVLDHSKKLEPTFEFVQKNGFCWSYYFKGYEGNIKIEYEKGFAYLVDELIHYKEDLATIRTKENGLRCLFETIEKKKRIENLFNPPMHHTRKRMYGHSDDVVNYVFQYLANNFGANKVEDYFAINEKEVLLTFQDYYLCKMMDHYFIFKRFSSDGMSAHKTIEEAKKFIHFCLDELLLSH